MFWRKEVIFFPLVFVVCSPLAIPFRGVYAQNRERGFRFLFDRGVKENGTKFAGSL